MPWVVFTEITWKHKRYGLIHTNSRWMGVSQPNVETMEAWSYSEHDARLASISFLYGCIFGIYTMPYTSMYCTWRMTRIISNQYESIWIINVSKSNWPDARQLVTTFNFNFNLRLVAHNDQSVANNFIQNVYHRFLHVSSFLRIRLFSRSWAMLDKNHNGEHFDRQNSIIDCQSCVIGLNLYFLNLTYNKFVIHISIKKCYARKKVRIKGMRI